MAVLAKQEVEIPLNGGMDVKQGAELQSASTLRLVEDLRWNKLGELERRPAQASSVAIASPGGLGVYAGLNGAAVIESRGEPYVVTDEYGVMSSRGKYLATGGDAVADTAIPFSTNYAPKSCRVGRLTIDRVSGDYGEQGFYAFASAPYASTTLVTAALVRNNGLITDDVTLQLRAVDIETGAIVAHMEADRSGTSGTEWAIDACEIVGGSNPGAVITVARGNSSPYAIEVYRYDPTTQNFVQDADISVAAGGVKHRTKTSYNAGRFLCAFAETSAQLFVIECAAGTLTTTTGFHVGIHSADASVDMVVSGTKVLIVSCDAGAGADVYAESYGSPASYIILDTLSATDSALSITAARETVSGNADRAMVFVSLVGVPAATPFYYHMVMGSVDFSAATVVDMGNGLFDSQPHASAVAWASTHGDRAYVLTSSAQVDPFSCMWQRGTRFIADVASGIMASPVARVAHDVYAERTYGLDTNLSSSFVVGNILYATLGTDISPDDMPNGGGPLPQSVALSRVDFTPRPLAYAHKDGVATVACGVVFDIDGETATLSQPYCRPLIAVSTAVAGTTSLTTGVSLIAVYRWIDAAGRERRSAPSAAVFTGPITNKRIDLYVATMPCPVFGVYDGRTYSVDVYVTEDGGASYYLANDASGDKFVAYSESDGFRIFTGLRAGVVTNPPPYSTGDGDDELVSEPTPSFIAVCTVGDRMFAVDAEDRSRIWYTKPFVAGYGPEWNTANTLTIGDIGVGISDVNGVPTIFAERGIWQVYGEGPNATGVGSFAPARRLPHEVECLDGLSVCKTGAGVFFRGRRGVYLLDTGLALQPVGLSIDSNLSVSGTPEGYCKILYDELSNEVHVIDFGELQPHYVFNLLEQKWSQWSQQVVTQWWKDACVVRGRVWFLHSDQPDELRRLYAIDEDAYKSDDVFGWRIETPWYRFDGATGQMRIWEIVAQMRLGSSNAGECGGVVAIDYFTRDNESNQFRWEPAGVDELKTGTDDDTVNFRCHIQAQRARQFKLEISSNAADYAFEGNVPIALRVLFGITKHGGRKINALQGRGNSPLE